MGLAPWWEGFDPPSLRALATVLFSVPAYFCARVAKAAKSTGGGLAAVGEDCLQGTIAVLEKAAGVMELIEDDLMRGMKEGHVHIAAAMHDIIAATEVCAPAPMHGLSCAVLCCAM